jgi:hypothetical protein
MSPMPSPRTHHIPAPPPPEAPPLAQPAKSVRARGERRCVRQPSGARYCTAGSRVNGVGGKASVRGARGGASGSRPARGTVPVHRLARVKEAGLRRRIWELRTHRWCRGWRCARLATLDLRLIHRHICRVRQPQQPRPPGPVTRRPQTGLRGTRQARCARLRLPCEWKTIVLRIYVLYIHELVLVKISMILQVAP